MAVCWLNSGPSMGATRPGSVDALHIRHDTLFIAWYAESIHHVYPFGTDTFVCKGDLFARQSIVQSTAPKKRRGRQIAPQPSRSVRNVIE